MPHAMTKALIIRFPPCREGNGERDEDPPGCYPSSSDRKGKRFRPDELTDDGCAEDDVRELTQRV